MTHGDKVDLVIEYEDSKDELKDHGASREETLASLKVRVLAAFSLEEGVNDNGQLLTYVLFHGHTPLLDSSATLGSIAGSHDLRLSLQRERHFFFYLDRKIRSPTATATGAQIKAMIKAVDPNFSIDHTLIEEGHGGRADEVITDGQVVSLEVDAAHPAKHFFSKPPTNFGAR